LDFTLSLSGVPFNLDYTLDSGQVFRWENRGEWWYGVVPGGVLKVRQEAGWIQCSSSSELLDSNYVRGYFRLDDNLQDILATFTKDETMNGAAQRFYGMRLIRQDRWECLASFVLTTNANIPRIKGMVAQVCARFGEPFDFEGETFRSFPRPERLSEAKLSELRDCGLGYRAEYIKRVARAVDEGRVDFSELALMDYETSRETMLKRIFGEKTLHGVGPKVADCVLLFSCGKDEAFPIDVWAARALERHYPGLLEDGLRAKLGSGAKASITGGEYSRTSAAAREFFGQYAGYAQQYLFMLARSEGRMSS